MEKIKIEKIDDWVKYSDLIVDYMKKGKVLVLPTDTIYGLSCLATDKKAINKIYKIKKRNKNNPLLVLVGSYCMLKEYFYVSARQEKYLRTVWPAKTRDIGLPNIALKPTTVVLKKRGAFPKNLNAGGDSVAVRLPNSKLLAKLVMKIGAPIVSTSLNVNGEVDIKDLNEVSKYFNHRLPDLVVDSTVSKEAQRKFKNQKPSKLIDIANMDDIKILRG